MHELGAMAIQCIHLLHDVQALGQECLADEVVATLGAMVGSILVQGTYLLACRMAGKQSWLQGDGFFRAYACTNSASHAA